MKAMDIKKGPVHINVPLFEPLVPELDRKHFEAGRSPYKVFKPNYGDVFSYQNRSLLLAQYKRVPYFSWSTN